MPGLRRVSGICRGKTDFATNTTVRKMLVVRRKRGVRNRPLPAVVIHRLVIPPVVRVRSVVHADLEVLPASEEERAVLAELARIAPVVQVDDQIRLRTRDEVL